jgi:hypothetical protein
MLFFKRILKQEELTEASSPLAEQRSMPRYVISPEFRLKATLNFASRVDSRSTKGHSRSAWHWKCRLLDCSEQGVRIQMDPALKVRARDLCDLQLKVEEFELTMPCHIANIRENAEGMVFGLKLDVADEPTWKAYCQLLEVVALGSSLKLHRRAAQPDESGYLLEHYTNNRPARLSVWRDPATSAVKACEFLLKHYLIRAAAGRPVEYLTSPSGRPAAPTTAAEIQRLFSWVVPNLPDAVPEDVRAFLKHHTG